MIRFVCIAVVAGLMLSCGRSDEVVRRNDVSGVKYEIVAQSVGMSSSKLRDLTKQASAVLEKRFESVQPDDGEIGRLNDERSVTGLSPDLVRFLAEVESLRFESANAFDYRLGSVRALWKLQKKHPEAPEPAALTAEMNKIQNLKLILDGSNAKLEGDGRLDIGHLGQGWAVDGAAEILIQAGVTSGHVKLGETTRIWGSASENADKWVCEVPPLPGDSVCYKIAPPDGALCLLHPAINGFTYHDKQVVRLLDPRDGMPVDSVLAVASWAPTAEKAGMLAEALFVMGRHEGFPWLGAHQPGGVFCIYRDAVQGGIIAEADRNLIGCVSDSMVTKR